MIEFNIHQFMQAARQYFFEMVPDIQPALATIPVKKLR